MDDQADKMMDEADHWVLRLLSAVLTGLLLVAVMYAVLPRRESKPPERLQLTETELKWVSERYRYHGISSSMYDPKTGEHYFIRDGKRCKL